MSDLKEFVLGYVQEVGGVVEPAGPNVHEVLIPEEVAEKWNTGPYRRLAFDEPVIADGEVTRIGYNHRLVEEMIADARSDPAPVQYYVNNLRLSKKGLDDLARSTWKVVNARVEEIRSATPGRGLNTYVRFNFKTALVSDSKQEQIVSVLMDAHTGTAAADPDRINLSATPHQHDPTLDTLSPGPIRWKLPDGTAPAGPLAPDTLSHLLNRAQTIVRQNLAEPIEELRRRSKRLLQLDEARLNDYYDEIEHDLTQRLKSASPERRANLEEKLAGVASEREAKLADAADRYRVRLELSLVNVMVILQPKLALPVNIQNRTTTAKAYAVWDPLLHRLEPLVCDVCDEAGGRLYLCYNGHLAHEKCLAPACIDCKRVFCTHCRDELGTCDVCGEPLCHHSRIACNKCGRGTCQAHRELCHANDGQPVDLSKPEPEPEPEPAPAPEPPPTPKAPEPEPSPPPDRKKEAPARRRRPSRTRHKRRRSAVPSHIPKPRQIEVVPELDTVVAYVLASRERTIAVRTWTLQPDEGIIMSCQCEKSACPADDRVIRPADPPDLVKQLLDQIDLLRQEYALSRKRVNYNRMVAGQIAPTGRLVLVGHWQNENVVAAAQAAFDDIYG